MRVSSCEKGGGNYSLKRTKTDEVRPRRPWSDSQKFYSGYWFAFKSSPWKQSGKQCKFEVKNQFSRQNWLGTNQRCSNVENPSRQYQIPYSIGKINTSPHVEESWLSDSRARRQAPTQISGHVMASWPILFRLWKIWMKNFFWRTN